MIDSSNSKRFVFVFIIYGCKKIIYYEVDTKIKYLNDVSFLINPFVKQIINFCSISSKRILWLMIKNRDLIFYRFKVLFHLRTGILLPVFHVYKSTLDILHTQERCSAVENVLEYVLGSLFSR